MAYVPVLAALGVLFCQYAFLPLWWRRPIWLRNFAAEEKDPIGFDGEPRPKTRPWHRFTIALLAVSLTNIICSILLSYLLGFDYLFLVPLVPSVRKPFDLNPFSLLINSRSCLA